MHNYFECETRTSHYRCQEENSAMYEHDLKGKERKREKYVRNYVSDSHFIWTLNIKKYLYLWFPESNFTTICENVNGKHIKISEQFVRVKLFIIQLRKKYQRITFYVFFVFLVWFFCIRRDYLPIKRKSMLSGSQTIRERANC